MLATHALRIVNPAFLFPLNSGDTYIPPMKNKKDTIIFCFFGILRDQRYRIGTVHNMRSVAVLIAVLA